MRPDTTGIAIVRYVLTPIGEGTARMREKLKTLERLTPSQIRWMAAALKRLERAERRKRKATAEAKREERRIG